MFDIKPDEMGQRTGELSQGAEKLRALEKRLRSAADDSALQTRTYAEVRTALRNVASAESKLATRTVNLADSLTKSVAAYTAAEQGIIDRAGQLGIKGKGSGSGGKGSGGDQGKDDNSAGKAATGGFFAGVWSFIKEGPGGEGYWGPSAESKDGKAKIGVGKWEWSVKPYGKYSDANKYNKDHEQYEEHHGDSWGVKASGSASVVQGEASGDYGILHGDIEGSVGTVAAEGTLGASLFKDGKFDPNAEAAIGISGSVLKGKASGRVGNDSYNAHASASGDVLTAKAGAKVKVSKKGVEAKAEAGAYLAQGEVSGGITILGLKIDVGVSGKAGGAGAEAEVKASSTSVGGKIGAGLGLGAGVSINVDWSGVPKAGEEAVKNIGKWWDGLHKKK